MNPFIVSVARTPITQFAIGGLSSVKATKLGAVAVRGVIERAKIDPNLVQEVIFGQVIQANNGQAPARQVALGAGLSYGTVCTTVNKVCASGMKAIMFAADSIRCGNNNIVMAGGMESMSQAPRYLSRAQPPLGHLNIQDGILTDGLTDAYDNIHMGVCAENTSNKLNLSREDQDEFAISSYKRSAAANESGILAKEIVPVELENPKSSAPQKVIDQDEEFKKVDFEKLRKLRAVFVKKDGTITAGNASTLNDGAAATLLMSKKAVEDLKVTPLAEIIAYADAECEPVDFPVAPALSIPKALKIAKLNVSDVARFEINEAFSAVVLANIKLLKLDPTTVNIYGGAVSLGHPIGMSGARIVNSLALHLKTGQIGVASICNGGGGASTVVVKRL